MLQNTIYIHEKPVSVTLTSAANARLAGREHPLVVEIELYFSCLIRKQVRFREHDTGADVTKVWDRLAVRFRPVMTSTCGKVYEGKEPPVTDFPIANPGPYVPHWLHIDYQNGGWVGEFGYNG